MNDLIFAGIISSVFHRERALRALLRPASRRTHGNHRHQRSSRLLLFIYLFVAMIRPGKILRINMQASGWIQFAFYSCARADHEADGALSGARARR